MKRLLLLLLLGCGGPPEHVVGVPTAPMKSMEIAVNDGAPKEELRLVPPEVYMRTYLQLFGGLAPLEVQKRARQGDGGQLFDAWDDYVSSLGFPDYRLDVPRQTQTNAIMVAAFERLGIALCDRAVEHDLPNLAAKPKGAPPPAERVIFAFDTNKNPLDDKAFAPKFDVLHRTFLGYPASLAPPERAPRFLALYKDIEKTHQGAKFTPQQAAWAAVCYGLIRHPEFNLY